MQNSKDSLLKITRTVECVTLTEKRGVFREQRNLTTSIAGSAKRSLILVHGYLRVEDVIYE